MTSVTLQGDRVGGYEVAEGGGFYSRTCITWVEDTYKN